MRNGKQISLLIGVFLSLEDLNPPRPEGLSFHPATIDATTEPQVVTFTLRLTDDLSGVSNAWWNLRSPSGKQSVNGYVSYPISGNPQDGNYQGISSFPRYSEAGTWHLFYLCMRDKANNNQCLYETDLKGRGFSTEIEVTGRSDLAPPNLEGLSFHPATINVSTEPQVVTFTLRLTDDLSGVSSAWWNLRSPSGKQSVNGYVSYPAFGNSRDGYYQGLSSFPRYSEAGRWHFSYLCMKDTTNNNQCLYETDLKGRGFTPEIQVIDPAASGADAGPSAACDGTNGIAEGAVINLNGICTDSGDKLLTGSWSQYPGGTRAEPVSDDSVKGESPLKVVSTVRAPDVFANENERFRLKCDRGTVSATDDVTICVNARPTANAQSILVPEDADATITLQGSDPNGESLTYLVIGRPVHGRLSGVPPHLTYTHDANFNGADSFTFRVHDGIQQSDPATVLISVGSVNDIPAACAGPDQNVMPPVAILLDGTCSSDPDGDSLSYRWGQVANNEAEISNPAAAQSIFTPIRPGVYTFQLIVNDGTIDSSPDSAHMTVHNSDPVANAGKNQRYSAGKPMVLGCHGSDANDDPLSYSWTQVSGPPLSGEFPVKTSEFTVTAPDVPVESVVVLNCAVSDGAGGYDMDTVTLTIVPSSAAEKSFSTLKVIPAEEMVSTPVESSPSEVIIEEPDRTWSTTLEEGNITLPTGIFDHQTAGSISWEIVSAPDRLSFEGNTIDTTHDTYQGGSYQIRQRVVDDELGAVYSEPVTVTMPNNPPKAPWPDNLDQGKYRFSYGDYSNVVLLKAVFSDRDGDQLSYDWSTDEEGQEVMMEGIGEITLWNRKAGTKNLSVTVEDGRGGRANGLIELFVPPPRLGPEDVSISITGLEESGPDLQGVRGEIQSPVIPIVRVNGAEAELSMNSSTLDTYFFTAWDVPMEARSDFFDIEILTDVDGDAVPLVRKLLTVGTLDAASFAASRGGCSLIIPAGIGPRTYGTNFSEYNLPPLER